MDYRSEVDGLRALAVVPVVLFHAGLPGFEGGFVGVDVFFVISGFLITTIIARQLDSGEFDLWHFYERRARRILPALIVVVLCCLPVAWMVLPPRDLLDFHQSVAAVSIFASNFLFWSESGYFESAAELKPLLHTWSLAVEEQFYVLFPLLAIAVWRSGAHRMSVIVAVLALLSLGAAQLALEKAPAGAFYLLPSRAWELLVGAAAALYRLRNPLAGVDDRARYLSILGLGAIVVSAATFENVAVPGWPMLVPTIGTVLVLLHAHPGTMAHDLLSRSACVRLGLLSYGIYLWHQPLFAFARHLSLAEPPPSVFLALASSSVLLAALSLRFVERPARVARLPPRYGARGVFVPVAGFSLLLLGVGLAGPLVIRVGIESEGAPTFEDRLAINRGIGRRCEGRLPPAPDCSTSAQPRVLLWGDSYAMHLYQGLASSEKDISLQQYTKSACAPVLDFAIVTDRYTRSWAGGCIDFNARVLRWLASTSSVETVVLSSPFALAYAETVLEASGDLRRDGNFDAVRVAFLETVERIREFGPEVVLVSPTPRMGADVGRCMVRGLRAGLDESACDYDAARDERDYRLPEAVETHVPVYWLKADICPGGVCDVMREDVLLFRDGGHLSKEGSAHLGMHNSWMPRLREMAR